MYVCMYVQRVCMCELRNPMKGKRGGGEEGAKEGREMNGMGSGRVDFPFSELQTYIYTSGKRPKRYIYISSLYFFLNY